MIKEDLQKLTEIRDLDVRISEVESERDEVPGEYALEQHAVDAQKAVIAAEDEELKEARIGAQHAESEVKAQEQLIAKFNGQLTTAKTNKEYNVILGQINGAKVELERAEEAGLAALDKVEQLRKKMAAQREALVDLEKGLEAARARVAGRMQELESEIAELRGRREAIAAGVAPDLLASYEHIRDRRDGLALVEVVDGTCHGCFVKVTAQEIMLLNQRDEVVRCRNCARILVLPS